MINKKKMCYLIIKKTNTNNFYKKKKSVSMLLWIKPFKYFYLPDMGWSSFCRFAWKKL